MSGTPPQSPKVIAARHPSASGGPGLPGGGFWGFWRERHVRATLGGFLLLSVAVSAAFLLSPGRSAPPIPDDDAVGKPAQATLRAPRDLDVIDPATTDAKRDEAARAVWPVYDHSASALPLLRRQIGQAFAQARAAVQEWKRSNPAKAAQLESSRAARARPGRAGTVSKEEQELLQVLVDWRDEFWKSLQAVIDDADYLELARSGFAPAVEEAALRLAARASERPAVADRALLLADRERGIVVRTLRGPEADAQPRGEPDTEREIRDLDQIPDVADLREEVAPLAEELLGDLPPGLRKALTELVRRTLRPSLAYDDLETRRRQTERRAQVKEVVVQLKRGEKVIGAGETISPQHLLLFHALRSEVRSTGPAEVRWGGGLFAVLLCVALFEFGRRNVRKFRVRSRDAVLLAITLIGQLLLIRGGMTGAAWVQEATHEALRGRLPELAAEVLAAALPYAAGSMLIRFLLSSEAALIWTAAFAPLCGLLAGGALQPALAALVGGIVAADRVGHAGSRAAVFRAGAWTGATNLLVAAAFALFQGRFWAAETIAAMAGGFLGGALIVPLIVLAFAWFFEQTFGYVTDIRLLQLASFNHPLLKDLILQAPGTYHNCIVAGTLVEAAARDIGANPLLARVGAYYHDIGKSRNPLYFGENQMGGNRHEQLLAAASTEIIRRHVSDGLELARQVRLPRQIADFIAQHHGTRVIGYFFHQAREEAERAGLPAPVEADFRYPGPKPQTREIALVMLADIVVATARNLPESTPAALQAVVDHAIASAVSDGQLQECDLTLRDLNTIAQSFGQSLQRVYSASESSGITRPARSLRVLDPAPPAAPAAGGAPPVPPTLRIGQP